MASVRVGIIGGSGLGDALAKTQGRTVEVDTPFGKPSSPIVLANWQGTDIAILQRHGVGHVYNPSTVNYRANIYALKSLGCTHVIASGAVGSLRQEIRPKDLVICDQVIDKTYRRAGTFFDEYLVAHVEMAMPFCPVLREHLISCADAVSARVHASGMYVCMEGPAFSTRAESEMHRGWGGDLIGMTCMPEAKLAREAELAYALVCLPSDYDCWRPAPEALDRHELLKEIIGNLTEATLNAVELIKAALSRFGRIAQTPSPAHTALELAIWTNRQYLDTAAAKRKYGVLVEKYL
jgi:5'-methylthioadenosine phosphorylase